MNVFAKDSCFSQSGLWKSFDGITGHFSTPIEGTIFTCEPNLTDIVYTSIRSER